MLIIIFLTLSLFYWLATLMAVIISSIKIKNLPKPMINDPARYPLVSIIIPIRNEADTLGPAFNSLVKIDYPRLEFILIDDRSTDGTSDLIDKIAGQDDRVKPIHIKELPDGWLGKVHAMKTGAEKAKGVYMLFTDADIHFSAGALRKTISLCINDNIDFITLITKFENVNIFLDCAMSFMVRAIFCGNRVWETNSTRSKHAVGFGPFMLVNREKLLQSRGFEWMKMDICDDLAFGLMMKRSGAKCRIFVAADDLSLTYARSMKDFASSIEKTGLAYTGKFNFFRAVFISIFAFIVEYLPFIALILSRQPLMFFLSLATVFIMLSSLGIFSLWAKRPLLSCLLSPVGMTVNVIMIIRSVILALKNKGLYWRGTFYPLEQLRKGQRI